MDKTSINARHTSTTSTVPITALRSLQCHNCIWWDLQNSKKKDVCNLVCYCTYWKTTHTLHMCFYLSLPCNLVGLFAFLDFLGEGCYTLYYILTVPHGISGFVRLHWVRWSSNSLSDSHQRCPRPFCPIQGFPIQGYPIQGFQLPLSDFFT